MNHLIPLTLLLVTVSAFADQPRTFTSKDGRSIQGTIVSARNLE